MEAIESALSELCAVGATPQDFDDVEAQRSPAVIAAGRHAEMGFSLLAGPQTH